LSKVVRKKKTRPAAWVTQLIADIIESIQDVKGLDIVKVDMQGIDDASTDFLIVCHGNSNTQVSAIAERIEKNTWENLGIEPGHLEGKRQGSWVLMDYFHVVVHVFHRETREFYRIEELWGDGVVTKYDNVA
jgi:ribosome-associated protein